MEFLIVFFGVIAILALASMVSALRGLNRSMEHLSNKLIEELHEIGSVVHHLQQSIEEISQKIREDGRREMMEPGVWTLAENRDQANPDLIEVLEDIRDK